MIRLLHIVAITLLIGSAAYAYSIKYETLYYAESLAKLRGQLKKERESIAIAKAEWSLLTRPDRLQRMIELHTDLQPMSIAQLGRLSELPVRPARTDPIGAKLETLGIEPVVAVTGSVKPRPTTPRRDGIAAKLDSLGLSSGPDAGPPSGAPRSGDAR